MLLRKLFPFALVFLFYSGFAQNIRINSVNELNGKITVNFSITPKVQGEKYNLELFSSHDNFRNPVTYVEGDIGEDISSSGTSLTAIWDVRKELKRYTGDIQVEIRGSVSYLPINMVGNVPGAKAGKSVSIQWSGGDNNDKIKVDLYREGVYYLSIGTIDNLHVYEWFLSKDIDKGKAYQLKLTNTNKTSESFLTDVFTIKGSGGAGKILIPLTAAVGAGTYFLVAGGGDDPTADSDLPNPPGPPSN